MQFPHVCELKMICGVISLKQKQKVNGMRDVNKKIVEKAPNNYKNESPKNQERENTHHKSLNKKGNSRRFNLFFVTATAVP
jgi:hypothetical protein